MSKRIEVSIMRDVVPALFGICRHFAAENGSKWFFATKLCSKQSANQTNND